MAGASTRVIPPFSALNLFKKASFSSKRRSMSAAPMPTVTGFRDMTSPAGVDYDNSRKYAPEWPNFALKRRKNAQNGKRLYITQK
jgi:hypothetical protein